MSKVFNIDYIRLVRLPLPRLLRRPTTLALLDALTAPIVMLYESFRSNRDANIFRLSVTPQVFSLEKMLNDLFDPNLRRIYIVDSVFMGAKYIYKQQENKDLYINLNADNKDLYVFSENQWDENNSDFIVNVPASIQGKEKDIHANLTAYKLASKTFKINFI